ncbi:uncharacterized protein LOC125769522 [Anopheles funestus]|uniref:uncharacterized protein LOC125769522 n=1 Tax=Anopheles funestus TaxID=62324 RepID=UPI0020C61AB2|nr:uncharacterized protein LOC125769522 [Anopheles funestus]
MCGIDDTRFSPNFEHQSTKISAGALPASIVVRHASSADGCSLPVESTNDVMLRGQSDAWLILVCWHYQAGHQRVTYPLDRGDPIRPQTSPVVPAGTTLVPLLATPPL